jgi:ABC-type lipoprotein export system ATPase subunit
MALQNANGQRKPNGEYNNKAIIFGQDIQKGFHTGEQWLQVLRGIDLSIPTGQFVAINGPSGSGKSTLLYLIGGLDRPDAGMIRVGGRRLDAMTSDELAAYRRRTIGFVFQSFYLVPTQTALENVALPGVFAGMSRDEREQRAARLLGALNMADRFEHRPAQLSGGQQQRVAIARALFNNPPIIMCDEPTGQLDTKTGQAVMELLRWFCTQQNKTIVVVTHDQSIAQYADRMIHLRDGQIVDDYLNHNVNTGASRDAAATSEIKSSQS